MLGTFKHCIFTVFNPSVKFIRFAVTGKQQSAGLLCFLRFIPSLYKTIQKIWFYEGLSEKVWVL
ncbi:hypothetical protein C7N43_21985 [Sphingobacteriales bacterium UPWRP_1]|nr:hypothetical protein B6N25_07125 [Sphingobacteriales bacterium TSM_CSS]PSJ74847.1 hypothetical protein C7N43_21985 [Sphingobacteriales bacterium UPWRP_1]